jgi:hypothetical protein
VAHTVYGVVGLADGTSRGFAAERRFDSAGGSSPMGGSMTQRSRFTRRQVLAGIGAVGLVTTGSGVARAVRGEPPYTHYTYAQSDGELPNLQVAWYETYNGTVQERSSDGLAPTNESFEDAAADGAFVDDERPTYVDTGPVVAFEDVLPGDEGSVVVGLLTTDRPGHVWFRPHAPAVLNGQPNYVENDHIEPERAAGDTTPDEGELQDELEIAVWYDRGLGGVGACNGQRDAAEVGGVTVGEPLAGDGPAVVAGTLREVSDRFPEGIRLFDDCLEADTNRCLGVAWSLPADTGNHVQTDAVGFELQFAATECVDDPTSPFVAEGEEAR